MKNAKLNCIKAAISDGASPAQRELEVCAITRVFRLLNRALLVGGWREVFDVIQGSEDKEDQLNESRF